LNDANIQTTFVIFMDSDMFRSQSKFNTRVYDIWN